MQANLKNTIDQAWSCVAPFWPLKSLVAVNPLAGLTNKPFDEAFATSLSMLQYNNLSDLVYKVNQKTIQWCQLFFDQGQATIQMPYKSLGLYRSVIKLMVHECTDVDSKQFIEFLPQDSLQAIEQLVRVLQINQSDQKDVFIKLLMSLSGWSSYVCYQADWNNEYDATIRYDFLAIRLLYTYLYKVEVDQLVADVEKQAVDDQMQQIKALEKKYHTELLQKLKGADNKQKAASSVQFLFCIDVRSEPMRKCLQRQGGYQTFGIAGFFGIPLTVKDELLAKKYRACPVFVEPKYTVINTMFCDNQACTQHQKKRISIKNIFNSVYKALKYTFTAPFALVEILGPWSLLWMICRTIHPCWAMSLKKLFTRQKVLKHVLWPVIKQDGQGHGISFDDQVVYAQQLLATMGLKKKDQFAQLVVFTAHTALTANNAYATMLNCGACGGHSGLVNAKVMATILNDIQVRKALKEHDIHVPDTTYFVAAEHNTTTDEIALYDDKEFKQVSKDLKAELQKNLKKAQEQCCLKRQKNFKPARDAVQAAQTRSCNWSEVIPEWGLAKNRAMIIGPSELTESIDLQGQVFLNSYDHEIDQDGQLLTTIMTGPVVVAHWINMQYLSTTINPVLYGSGSKITQNVTGKLGVMQGNMSDLMTGLSLQSVNFAWNQTYHEPVRLMIVIYAPRDRIMNIVQNHELLHDLCKNEWIFIICYDPATGQQYQLQVDFF